LYCFRNVKDSLTMTNICMTSGTTRCHSSVNVIEILRPFNDVISGVESQHGIFCRDVSLDCKRFVKTPFTFIIIKMY